MKVTSSPIRAIVTLTTAGPTSGGHVTSRAHRPPPREQVSQDEDPIFASREGTPLQHRNVSHRGFERAAKEAGIEGVTFHDLRHAAASRLIAKGLDPVTVASVLGHGNPTITLKVYAHLFNREQRDDAVRRALNSRSI